MKKPSKKTLWQREYAERQPPEWLVWKGMKRRCHEPSHMMYCDYGAVGIKVCDRWMEHRTGFKNFMADMGPRPSADYHLDRIDPDGNYTKENCRWLPKTENLSRVRRGNGKDELKQNGKVESKDETEVSDMVPF
jgi:hypothetical protein